MSDDLPARSHDEEHETFVREALTMALYVSLSLIAVFFALPLGASEDRIRGGLAILLTGLALVFAHAVAMRIATRLGNQGSLTAETQLSQRAHALGGVAVAVGAALPVFLLGHPAGAQVSELLLLGFVALVGYRAVRTATTRARAVVYVAIVFVAVAAFVIIKGASAH